MRERLRQWLGSRVLRAAGWSLTGQLGAYAVRLFSTVLLTRLLVPADYGAVAIVMVVGTVLWLLSDVGIRASVLRSPHPEDPRFQDTAWTLQLLRGLVIGAATLAIALALATAQSLAWLPPDSAWSRADLPGLIAASAASAMILGAVPIRTYMASRTLQMRTLTLIDLSAQLVTTVVTLGLAYATRSVWSVIAGMLVGNLWQVATAFRWLPGQAHRCVLDPAARRELLSFGRWILLSSAVTALTLNGDRILLGLWMDDAALGLYAIAITLPSVVLILAGRSIGSVAHARMAEAFRESRASLQRNFRRFLPAFDLVTGTAAGLLMGAAEPITHWLYDSRYAGSAALLATMSWSLVLARSEVYNAAYLAQGHSSRLPVLSAVQGLALLLGVPLAHSLGGLQAALWALALRHLISLPLHWVYCRRDQLLHWRSEWAILPALGMGWGLGRCAVALAS